MEPPVSLPSEYGTDPAATVAALPPLLPPGTRSMSQGLPTGPYAEFSVDDPMANSSQLVLPTHTAPASNKRCTAVPVYGGLNPLSIFDPAVVSMPSTQSTSLSAMGMPHNGEAVSGCSSSVRAAASACCSASSRVTTRYAFKSFSLFSACANASARSARGVVVPSRSAAARSVIVLRVKFVALNGADDEIAPVCHGRIAQRRGGTDRRLWHVSPHHIDEVTDLRRLCELRSVDLLQPRDVTEDRFQLAEQAALLRIAQPQAGKHRNVIDLVPRKCHGAA